MCAFVGEVTGVVGRTGRVGVVGRTVHAGEEGEGDCGRRKGEVRGEPKERGEGLYVVGIACEHGERWGDGGSIAIPLGQETRD